MLEQFSYCPILHTRQSEMRALLQLPAQSKDRMFPTFVARPWPRAKQLSATWDKIAEAFGDRRFALDLDSWKFGVPGTDPAASDFNELFSSEGGYARYYDLVRNLPTCMPVLRGIGSDEELANVQGLDRGIVVRLQHDRSGNVGEIIDNTVAHIEDVVFVVDVGWTRDILSRELWADGVVARINSVRNNPEVVFSGSSFPDQFSRLGSRDTRPLNERLIYSNLVRRYNQTRFKYSDWGSTRAPSDPVPMRSVPRIDLPTSAEWIFFRRAADEDEDFRDIATRVMSDPVWQSQPTIWGISAITSTAANLPGAIRSPAMAASARINIHLHKQAFFEIEGNINDSEEPFTDD